MIRRALALPITLLAACTITFDSCRDDCVDTTCGTFCGDEIPHCSIISDSGLDADGFCNLLTQAGCMAGEKCTWRVDALMPLYVGHIGCAPDGTAKIGEACMFGAPGATGYDNCARGAVCGNYRSGAGTCKLICDQQGGQPLCDAQHVCVTQPDLFETGDTTPPAAGLCDRACDPLADNDFDGSGVRAKTGSGCGSNSGVGCYGYPSYGTPPATGFTCMPDLNASQSQPIGLRHRVQCTEANSCADPGPTIFVNSCNQGYLPLLRESAMVSTAICIAMCKPKNCYAGNCGANNIDRLGEAPHRCTDTDRVGTFNTAQDGEHCRYSWWFERDDSGFYLTSATSDTLGFCVDHSQYRYDTNGDGSGDIPVPPCASLPDGYGSGSALGAADLGCVDTTHAPPMLRIPIVGPGLRLLDRMQVAP